MSEYISNFIPGFEKTVSRHLVRELGGAEIICADGGFAHFRYAGKPEFVARLPFINNSFKVIAGYRGGGLAFGPMVKAVSKRTFGLVGRARSFRVRFSLENRFEKVSANVLKLAEYAVVKNCGIAVNRLNPECEFWYVIRRDGQGFFGQLLEKRGAEKLRKGELRPELACMLCLDCEFGKDAVICDPYAGYGAIPAYICGNHVFSRLYVSDIDAGLIERLRKTDLGKDKNVTLTVADAANLSHIPDGAVDLIVTDPPWGYISNVDDISVFYIRALTELNRIVSQTGKIVLLTGRPADMIEAARIVQLRQASRANILVNGKKASVFTYTPKQVL
jgi:hypothetical protein